MKCPTTVTSIYLFDKTSIKLDAKQKLTHFILSFFRKLFHHLAMCLISFLRQFGKFRSVLFFVFYCFGPEKLKSLLIGIIRYNAKFQLSWSNRS